jgi:hypothetical protein
MLPDTHRAALVPSWRALLALGAAAILLVAGGSAEATGTGLGRGLPGARNGPRQPLGPIHKFKEPTSLERWTNRPKTDAQRGLRDHSFWVRPHPGRKGGNEHLRDKLHLDHSVKRREQRVAPPGTTYHERPLRGGPAHEREVILHNRVPKNALEFKEKVRK